MTYSCCSGNFSTSCGCSLPTSGSSCDSPWPSNLVYSTTSCSSSTCQLHSDCQVTCTEPTSCQRSCVVSRPCQVESSVNTGCQENCIEPTSCQRSCVVSRPCQVESSLNTGCQETCIEPTSCQRSCLVSRPCQTACYYPRSSTPCSPCEGIYAGSLSCGYSNFHPLSYDSRSFFSGDRGPRGFRSLNYEIPVFPFLSDVSTFCYPSYLLFNTYQPSFCVPTCGPRLSGISC
ncbi:keratin-associated protein 13-1-like [Alexandromys fortis]|uniref:keratin-associated protein 13-1-like n=1 Tax=Alexandromys fortis TaxID=100897 RepID=UPI002152B36A|nr:keratin-associated protein 13-1-like [Microtus fortis]